MSFAIAKTVDAALDVDDDLEDGEEDAPGVDQVREALLAMERGHAVKAIDLLTEGLYAYSSHQDKPIPWLQ